MAGKYWFVSRPPETTHGYPFVVYDCNARIHLDLTSFTKESRVNRETTKIYLYALLPYFTWLHISKQHQLHNHVWNESAEQVRLAVEDYLIQHMSCQVQQHREGFQLVRPTASTPTSIHMFLVALKCFYKIMKYVGRYEHPNPLVDSSAQLLTSYKEILADAIYPPPMPEISGVQEPNPRKRLTDSYYKFVGDRWIPQIVDDSNFPTQVLKGGRSLPKWNLRAEVVTRILFESGARVSEVVGLTVADWVERGMNQEANTFSKGSNGRRVKFIRFSTDSAKLLRRYFNQERIKHSYKNASLEQHLKLAGTGEVDLKKMPLFLTNRRTALSSDNYRDNYWKPACLEAEINANVHQARHWYVTMALKQIHEISNTEAEITRRKRELREYMKWQSEETMRAYDHYFDSLRHAQIQDCLHARMDTDLSLHLEEWEQLGQLPTLSVTPKKLDPSTATTLFQDEDILYLLKIGGKSSDR